MEWTQPDVTGSDISGVGDTAKASSLSPSAPSPSAAATQMTQPAGPKRCSDASRVYLRRTHGKYATKPADTQTLTRISSPASAAVADSAPPRHPISCAPDTVQPCPTLLQEPEMPHFRPSAELSTTSPYCTRGDGAVTMSEPNGHILSGTCIAATPTGSFFFSKRRHMRRRFRDELELVRKLHEELENRGAELAMAAAVDSAPASYPSWPLPIEIPDTQLHFSATDHETPIPVGPLAESVPAAITPVVNTLSQHPVNISVVPCINSMPEESTEKRNPKANAYYKNYELFLAHDKYLTQDSHVPKKSKTNGHTTVDVRVHCHTFKKCSSLLAMLMKHKFGWVFNKPVDPQALGLVDYFHIIKSPMDLGTIKQRLGKKFYNSPKEFAEDVRLTFSNAMTYNPKGQDVHIMAVLLLQIFEDHWAPIEAEMNDYLCKMSAPTRPPPMPAAQSTFLEATQRPASHIQHFVPQRALKKPKAKDVNKREMTVAEKCKLSRNLETLPPEKLDQIVLIIRRKNLKISELDDEIELDIDSMDTETLWELDRFVSNYKKYVSKHKRKTEIAMLARLNAEQNAQGAPQQQVQIPTEDKLQSQNRVPGETVAFKPTGEEQTRENAQRSSSTSSSSSDSSTSDSSDSSSADGSDANRPY